jgi:Rrf2 family protein
MKGSENVQISRQCDYAIRTIFELARIYPKMSSSKKISSKYKIPQPFLNKIIQELVKIGLFETVRGAHGGVRLCVPPDSITLKDVIEHVDGPIVINECLMGIGLCFRQTDCPAHQVLLKARKAFLRELNTRTIAELIKDEKDSIDN